MILQTDHPLARATVTAIQTGDVDGLSRLLADKRAGAGSSRSAHAWRVPHARFTGPHVETPLHWAASSDDVDVLDALLDAGADIDADGAVIAGGTPPEIRDQTMGQRFM